MKGTRGGAASFVGDYIYHLVLDNTRVLEAHMLEIFTSIADKTPSDCKVVIKKFVMEKRKLIKCAL